MKIFFSCTEQQNKKNERKKKTQHCFLQTLHLASTHCFTFFFEENTPVGKKEILFFSLYITFKSVILNLKKNFFFKLEVPKLTEKHETEKQVKKKETKHIAHSHRFSLPPKTIVFCREFGANKKQTRKLPFKLFLRQKPKRTKFFRLQRTTNIALFSLLLSGVFV
jgi:hypothetical protein